MLERDKFKIVKLAGEPIAIQYIYQKGDLLTEARRHITAVSDIIDAHQLDTLHLIVHCHDIQYTGDDIDKLNQMHMLGLPGSASDPRINTAFVTTAEGIRTWRDAMNHYMNDLQQYDTSPMLMFASLDNALQAIRDKIQDCHSHINTDAPSNST